MRNAVIFSCIIGALLIVLAQFGFFEALLMFLLAGVVPGTSYSIPSNIMYGLLLIGITIVIVRIVGFSVLDLFFVAKKVTPKKSAAKKRLPRRRYSQI